MNHGAIARSQNLPSERAFYPSPTSGSGPMAPGARSATDAWVGQPAAQSLGVGGLSWGSPAGTTDGFSGAAGNANAGFAVEPMSTVIGGGSGGRFDERYGESQSSAGLNLWPSVPPPARGAYGNVDGRWPSQGEAGGGAYAPNWATHADADGR